MTAKTTDHMTQPQGSVSVHGNTPLLSAKKSTSKWKSTGNTKRTSEPIKHISTSSRCLLTLRKTKSQWTFRFCLSTSPTSRPTWESFTLCIRRIRGSSRRPCSTSWTPRRGAQWLWAKNSCWCSQSTNRIILSRANTLCKSLTKIFRMKDPKKLSLKKTDNLKELSLLEIHNLHRTLKMKMRIKMDKKRNLFGLMCWSSSALHFWYLLFLPFVFWRLSEKEQREEHFRDRRLVGEFFLEVILYFL